MAAWHDGYHRFCEGALVLLDGGHKLACVMRENHSAGIPSFVSFSSDLGHTWSRPQMLPFAFHRPYAAQLPDGRVLVTGRHVNGGLGTYAWCGDLHAEAGHYQIGGPRTLYSASLTREALEIDNQPNHECRYTLLPPESSHSQVTFEADLRVEGPKGQGVAFLSLSKLVGGRGPLVLYVAPDRIYLSQEHPDFCRPVDMTTYRRIALHHERGLFEVRVDGEQLITTRVMREEAPLADFHGGNVTKRTQWGQFGEAGRSFWRSVTYAVHNPTLDDFKWSWRASDGAWPDRYQRTRLIQIHGNEPTAWPDHGYSSWTLLPDGRIFLTDYTNLGDPPGKSHLVGVYLDREDIR